MRLINEQTEVALLLVAPLILGLLALAPWIIPLLYSAEFLPAVEVFRWHLIGDILKVLAWPLGFIMMAQGAGKTQLAAEAAPMAIYLLILSAILPSMGVEGAGVAFIALTAIYFATVFALARWRIGFRYSRFNIIAALLLLLSAVAVVMVGRQHDGAGAALGLFLSGAAGLYALLHLASRAGAGGLLGKVAQYGQHLRARLSRRR